MCGRTSLFARQSVIEDRFDATATRPITPRYNIAPGDDIAVIRNDADDEVDLLEWGLVPSWADRSHSGFINARAETVAEKPSFREAYQRRRCLVLADGFYEWQQRSGGKQPYRVARADDAPFAMAGLWEKWERDGDVRRTATIITTGANDLMRPIHDRMPVVLAPDEERQWLRSPEASLLDPYGDDDFRASPISKAVNDPTNDSPALIDPIEDDQRHLGDYS